jgi:muramoyltetrapeptide carboxypeptidase
MSNASYLSKCRIVGCSDGLIEARRPRIAELAAYIESLGYSVTIDSTLFVRTQGEAAAPASRADALVSAITDPDVKLILDVTGGDATSSMLRLLPQRIDGSGADTRYFGISDNTTIHCALARAAPKLGRVYWYPTNLVLEHHNQARAAFEHLLSTDTTPPPPLYWANGRSLRGPIVGGNIRCLLKLAGTTLFPDLVGSILLLESASGNLGRIQASVDQLADMRALESVAGVILGEFGELEADERASLAHYLCQLTNPDLPVCCTDSIGHGTDTVPVILGRELTVDP